MTISEYIEEYRKVLIMRRLAPNTVGAYSSCLGVYLSWCGLKDIFPPQIEKPQLREFLSNQEWSTSYLKQMRGTVDNFYTHVLGIPYIMQGMPYPKATRSLPEYFTPYELNALFNAVKNPKQRLLLKIQYACALRVHELVKLKWSDFSKTFNGYDLRVYGKGKLSIIPVPSDTIVEITQVLGDRFGESGYLFVGQFGGHYDEQSVRQIVNRAMMVAGINKEGSTHLLRHSRATHLIQNGVSTRHVQILLRHNSSKTTEIYTHLSKEDLRDAFDVADGLMIQKLNNQDKKPIQKELNK